MSETPVEKCQICGRSADKHRFRVTTFEKGATEKELHQKTRPADRVWVEDGLLWVQDSCVKSGTSMSMILEVIVTDLWEEEE